MGTLNKHADDQSGLWLSRGAENTFQGTNHHLSNSENIENQRPHQQESRRQVGHQGPTQGGGSHQSTDMLPPSNHPGLALLSINNVLLPPSINNHSPPKLLS